MAFTAGDIEFRLSETAGSGDSNAQPDPNASLGGFISTTVWDQTTQLFNLFDVITVAEDVALDVEYRCLFVVNLNPSDTFTTVKAWILSQIIGGADCEIGVDPAGATAKASVTAQAATPADESTAPAGVTFSAAATEGASISLPDLAPDQCVAIWIKRTATASGALNPDGLTIRVKGEGPVL